jgi:hypothetical protein
MLCDFYALKHLRKSDVSVWELYVLNSYVLGRVFKVMLTLSDVNMFTLCETALSSSTDVSYDESCAKGVIFDHINCRSHCLGKSLFGRLCKLINLFCNC